MVCNHALLCDRAVSKLHKILRNKLHCYPYKISHVQKLLPVDLLARESFALEFLVRMEMDKEVDTAINCGTCCFSISTSCRKLWTSY